MGSFSVQYRFSQQFRFPAKDAYVWCTDYQEEDVALMGEKGKRKVIRINEETLILTDSVLEGGRRVARKRLVRLFPDRLFWTITRLSSEGKYSQFLYQIVQDEGGRSRLDFTGSHVYYNKERPTLKEVASMAQELARQDASAWVLLAKAMEKDLGGPNKR